MLQKLTALTLITCAPYGSAWGLRQWLVQSWLFKNHLGNLLKIEIHGPTAWDSDSAHLRIYLKKKQKAKLSRWLGHASQIWTHWWVIILWLRPEVIHCCYGNHWCTPQLDWIFGFYFFFYFFFKYTSGSKIEGIIFRREYVFSLSRYLYLERKSKAPQGRKFSHLKPNSTESRCPSLH